MADEAKNAAQSGGATENGNQAQTFESFGKFIEKQPDEVKALYEKETSGLKNTVQATRQERDDLAKQIKELLPKAEKGSDVEKTLNETLGKLEAAERRATFAEQALQPGIDCKNIKAAYALAVSDDLFDRKGLPNWDAIKKEAPELFGKPAANGNAGAGTSQVTTAQDINDLIRRAAGR